MANKYVSDDYIISILKLITYKALQIIENTEEYTRVLTCGIKLTDLDCIFDDFESKFYKAGIHKLDIKYIDEKEYVITYDIDTKFLVNGVYGLSQIFDYAYPKSRLFEIIWERLMKKPDIFNKIDDYIYFRYRIVTNNYQLKPDDKIDYRLLRVADFSDKETIKDLSVYNNYIVYPDNRMCNENWMPEVAENFNRLVSLNFIYKSSNTVSLLWLDDVPGGYKGLNMTIKNILINMSDSSLEYDIYSSIMVTKEDGKFNALLNELYNSFSKVENMRKVTIYVYVSQKIMDNIKKQTYDIIDKLKEKSVYVLFDL